MPEASTASNWVAKTDDGKTSHESERFSILAVTSELPWPLDSGGHLRTFHLLRALARKFRVRLVTAASADQADSVAALEQNGIIVCPAFVRPRAIWRECLRAASAAVRREPYVLYRRHNRPEVRARLEKELAREQPNLLYLDHLDSAVFRFEPSPVPLVIDCHNVYSTLVRRASSERRFLVRRYFLREAKLLEKMELRAARLADCLLTVSQNDAEHYSQLAARKIHIIPNGVDSGTYGTLPVGRGSEAPLILYVGAMSWAPNVSAACFLASEVLPMVRTRFPAARLRIVGRDPSREVRALERQPGVEVTGTVPTITPHLREAHVLAVPLHAGGGTRLKILEAFASGLPVVSTPVGCEGLTVTHGEHLLISEREDFAASILSILGNKTFGVQLAVQARTLARHRYDWSIVGEAACAAVEETARAHCFIKRGIRR